MATFAVLSTMSSKVNAQVKIGDNPTVINPGSALEIESTNKGLLMPRISLTSTTVWGLAGTSAAGMHVYNINTGIISTNTDYPTLAAKIGEYYWDGTGWVALAPALKTTSISSFPQTSGVLVTVPANIGISYCPPSSPPPACATNINEDGSFTITNSTDDVILDIIENFSIANNTATNFAVAFAIYVDKTTPGVFESVGITTYSQSTNGCTSNSLITKAVLKNLPIRTYNVRVYAIPRANTGGGVATIGIGVTAATGCGQTSNAGSLIVSVSQ